MSFTRIEKANSVDEMTFKAGVRIFGVLFVTFTLVGLIIVALASNPLSLQAFFSTCLVGAMLAVMFTFALSVGLPRYIIETDFTQPNIRAKVYAELLWFKVEPVQVYNATLIKLGSKTGWYDPTQNIFLPDVMEEMVNRRVMREAVKNEINHPQIS